MSEGQKQDKEPQEYSAVGLWYPAGLYGAQIIRTACSCTLPEGERYKLKTDLACPVHGRDREEQGQEP